MYKNPNGENRFFFTRNFIKKKTSCLRAFVFNFYYKHEDTKT
jgi:hypothetical protein